MRLQKLLAIAAVCPLAVIEPACQRIDQPVGQYSAAAARASREGAPDSPEPETAGASDAEPAPPEAGSGSLESSTPEGEPISTAEPAPEPPFVPPATASIPTMTSSGNPMKEQCIAAAYDVATRSRLDMYVVLDANITLPYTGLWEFVTSGLRRFVSDRRTQGTGVGLRYFGSVCDPNEYNFKPQVEVGVLPANLKDLTDALSARNTFMASPMFPALEGGIAHQLRRAKANPGTKQIVVLMTDGFTQDVTCSYRRQDVEDAAAKGFSSEPSIETYVIGFGLPDTMNSIADDVLARFAALDPIAESGGTRKAYNVKGSQDPTQVQDALTAIRRAAQPCIYEVPDDVDPAKLNLMFFTSGVVPRVDDEAKCGQAPGFYYESDGSSRPATLKLCSASCSAMQKSDAALVLYTGCPTVRR